MPDNQNRLLLEFHKVAKDVNRETINPRIELLKCNDLLPVIELVARARANYLEEVFNLAITHREKPPTVDELKRLQHLRITFEELSKGSHALETAIERGYLDVDSH